MSVFFTTYCQCVISKVNKKQKPLFYLTLLYASVGFRNNVLVHHKFIQNNEIHVKIGDKHGSGSLKMSYQIHNPNNTDNTIVSSIFEAKDYRSNTKIGMTRFREQVKALQSVTWN